MKVAYGDIFPKALEKDTLYVSRAYSTTAHLCASGCGFRVVLPLGKGGWKLIDEKNLTVYPSVHVPKCNSHYWIRGGQIKWAPALSADEIEEYAAADQDDYVAELTKQSLLARAVSVIRGLLRLN
jgi:hypothetical protein